MRAVTYNNTSASPNTQARQVTFSLGASSLYFPDNGHYYEFVDGTLTWDEARSAAEGPLRIQFE